MRCLLPLLLALAIVAPAAGQERITNYDIDVVVNVDGSVEVTEQITIRAEGNQVRRGIYRDFPTRYRDRLGNRYVVDFDVISVQRDGGDEPWFTERVSNGVRVNTGNDDFLPVPASYTFTLRYRTTRQLGFFAEHDELYWNAIGTGWVFPIEAARVVVRLPEPVPVERLSAEGYTGPQGAQGQDYEAGIDEPGVAVYRLTQPLPPQHGFTIVLAFPKGIVTEPGAARRTGWLLRDNSPLLLALAGLLLLFTYFVREWRRVGRDPRAGIIIARYEPPAGHTPASLRYMRRWGYDMRCFSADVIDLAVHGELRVERTKKFLSERWSLHRTTPAIEGTRTVRDTVAAHATGHPTVAGAAATLPHSQRALLESLFAGGPSIELTQKQATKLQSARTVHSSALSSQIKPEYLQVNGGSTLRATLIAVVALLPAFILAEALGGAGTPFLVAAAVIAVITLVVFAGLVRAPTQRGRALLDEIEGLRLYLSVAERDDLASLRGPDQPPLLDAERFEALLPYAVALDVEDAWTKKFTAAVGAAAAAQAASRMTWYSGTGPITDIGGFTRAVGSSLSSQISSSATPPGSSSGSGGGGSSGGGGGGGGGGGR